jgi:tetratricopeptide (TPR) repeat protein
MASQSKLDAASRSRKDGVIFLILAALLLSPAAFAQQGASDSERLASAKSAFDAERWEEAARLSQGPENQPPDLDFLEGLALARLEKWNEAKSAFTAGLRKAPQDSRFLMELAGVAYKQKDYRTAKRDLHAALRLNPRDAYSREFLATLYFLDGNLEAALKYWNPEDKPRLRSVVFAHAPQLKEPLRERALAFNAPQVLTGDALLTTEARLENLGVFSGERIALAAGESGSYDATLHVAERNGFGDSKIEGIVSLLSGLPYATVYPEFYNFGGQAINLTALGRWDSEKRRVSAMLSLPLRSDPNRRLRLFADARNENWNLSQTFLGAGTALSDVNVRRIAAGAEIDSVVNGRWSWSAGAEMSNRDFRNVPATLSQNQRDFFTGGGSLSGRLGVQRSLVRVPERRFVLDASAEAKAGREFAQGLGPFAMLRGSLHANWPPRAKGDDYEINARMRAGATAGKETLDELFQLGIERDNDLWLRGHTGTLGGRKGAPPLGRRYFLSNWEMDKNVYRNGIFTVKVGPFLDNGAIADSSGAIGSREWLWDSGLQCKVRILGEITAVFSYGRNLRGGKGVFYGSVLQESLNSH